MARWKQENVQDAWRLFVAEGVRMVSESAARFAGGPYMTAKWGDIINPKPEETRTPQQVIDHVLARLKEVK